MFRLSLGVMAFVASLSGCAAAPTRQSPSWESAQHELGRSNRAGIGVDSGKEAEARTYRSLFRFNALGRGHYASPSRHGGYFGGRSREQRGRE